VHQPRRRRLKNEDLTFIAVLTIATLTAVILALAAAANVIITGAHRYP